MSEKAAMGTNAGMSKKAALGSSAGMVFLGLAAAGMLWAARRGVDRGPSRSAPAS